jgi:hypothetical protein
MYEDTPIRETIGIIKNSLSNNDKISIKHKQELMVLIQSQSKTIAILTNNIINKKNNIERTHLGHPC